MISLRQLYGHPPAAEFGPKALAAVRQEMIAAQWCRTLINHRIDWIRRVFRWATAEELVPVTVYQSLKTLTGLQKGRTTVRESEPVKPVDPAHVAAVLPHLSRHTRAMVELQQLTGMRPGEVCAIRFAEVDRSSELWVYRPTHHKTAHRGRPRGAARSEGPSSPTGPVANTQTLHAHSQLPIYTGLTRDSGQALIGPAEVVRKIFEKVAVPLRGFEHFRRTLDNQHSYPPSGRTVFDPVPFLLLPEIAMSMRPWIRGLFTRPATRPIRNAPCRARLALEVVEDRLVPSAVTVGNLTDDVNGDTSSIAALISNAGADGISLREAVAAANNTAGDDAIDFAVSGTITLGGSQLDLFDTTGATTITGPQKGVTVSGGGSSRVFQITEGATTSISGMTITGGNASFDRGGGVFNEGTLALTDCTVSGNTAGPFGSGGGVCNWGTLTMTDCTVRDNSVGDQGTGGGLENFGGTATLIDCTVSGNTADSFGGGLNNGGRPNFDEGGYFTGTLSMSNCTVSGNTSGQQGGGLCNGAYAEATLTGCTIRGNSTGGTGGGMRNTNGGTAALIDCTVRDNSAGGGGGLDNFGPTSTLTLTACTVSGNTADFNAGGLGNSSGTLTMTDCTIRDNSAGNNGGGIANSGNLLPKFFGSLTLTNCTILDNSAGHNGGGLFNGLNGRALLTGCTIHDNSAVDSGGGIATIGGVMTIADSIINSNRVVNHSGTALGGGIFSENGSLSLTNCTINDNKAKGATAQGGGIYALSSTVDVQNSTVEGNKANGTVLGEGGGIYSYDSALTLLASTVHANKATTAFDDIFDGP